MSINSQSGYTIKQNTPYVYSVEFERTGYQQFSIKKRSLSMKEGE